MINLVFDIDDTMYDLMEPFRKTHEEFFADRTSAECTELFFKMRSYSDIILEQEQRGEIPTSEAFYRRIVPTYRDVGIHVGREEGARFEKMYRYEQSRIQLFDFMKEILDYCRQEKIRMAVLTNGTHENQRRKIAALKLEQWFEPENLFVSAELGYHKPDTRAFKMIEERMGFRPENTWYVGDTYECDIVGAEESGWHTIWLNHRKRTCPEQVCRAEVELKEGKELLPLIIRISKTADS